MKNFASLNESQLEIVCGGTSVSTKTSSDKGSQGDIEQNPSTGQQDLPQSDV